MSDDYYDVSLDMEKSDKELKAFVLERRQRKRIFQRLSSGFYFHKSRTIRFLTLTSSPRSGPIRDDWKEFVKRVRRSCPIDFIEHLSGAPLMSFKSMLEPVRFEYLAVFTDEGEGVVHCVYVGDYLPVEWIRDLWSDIHQAYGVNIRFVRSCYNPGGLAGYLITQYVGKQNAIRHYQMSKGWLPSGYADAWTKIKRDYKKDDITKRLVRWHKWLDKFHQKQL